MYWIEFVFSAVVIVFAGIRLTEYADKLSDQTNIGKAWIGIVLLGFVTSLPEAITSLTSVISLHANDMAIGNVLGSNNFNPMLIVVMDIFYRRGSVTNDVELNKSHDISSMYAMILSFVVIGEIFLGMRGLNLSLSFVSLGSILIAILYFVGMRALATIDVNQKSEESSEPITAMSCTGNLMTIWINLIVSAVVVILAAMFLANAGDAIAAKTGLGQTFVGSIFLAVVTSLPEMVVSLSALRLGSFDLAIGNIFGSNMTNIFVVFICDLFSKDAILSGVNPTHMFTAAMSIVLVIIGCVGIKMKNKKTIFGLGWDSLLMFVVFSVGTVVLYQLR